MGDEVDDYYRELPDGTIKQRNPFTGTQVWTVPGRGARPLATPVTDARPLSADDRLTSCAFCPSRLRQTPPEKARPTFRGSASFTVTRRCAQACSFVGASETSKRNSRTSTSSKACIPASTAPAASASWPIPS